MHDYYQILNVDPACDPEAIRKAYLRRAMIDHPDRGGSHERMRLVNEAFEILYNPESRRHYDAARANRADSAAQATATADAEHARRRAADYPRRWAEFEAWLGHVGTDFSQARYSSGGIGIWQFPVVRDSVTGWVFVVVGGIIGAALAVSLVHVPKRLTRDGLDRNQFYLGAAGALAGAWVFAGVHRLISDAIKEARAKAAAPAADPAPASAPPPEPEPTSTPPPEPAPETRILACEQCGQKLRVPKMDSHMRVTCKTCRHQFWLPPEPEPQPPFPTKCDTKNCPTCGSTLWTGSECGACGHGTAVSGNGVGHPKQEWTPGTILVAVAGAVLMLGFFVWLIAGLGSAWGDGKSRGFTETLKVGVVLVVVIGVGVWIWSKGQQKSQ